MLLPETDMGEFFIFFIQSGMNFGKLHKIYWKTGLPSKFSQSEKGSANRKDILSQEALEKNWNALLRRVILLK